MAGFGGAGGQINFTLVWLKSHLFPRQRRTNNISWAYLSGDSVLAAWAPSTWSESRALCLLKTKMSSTQAMDLKNC